MTIKVWVLSFAAAIVGWFGSLVLIMLLPDAAPGAVVYFPTDEFVAQLPDNIAIVGAGRNWISVQSDTSNLGLKLYSAGALIVLPADLSGCIKLS